MMIKKLTFEDCYPVIDREIQKRRSKWTLDAIAWMNWDDVAQNLRIHINKKFSMWDQSRPLQNWLAAVIHHQLVNSIRNLYTNFSPICNKCAAFDGADGCIIYGDKRDECPLYCQWKKTKEKAYNLKLPLSSFYHEQEIQEIPHEDIDMDKAAINIHDKMELLLKAYEFRIYSLLFINHKTEQEIIDIMGLGKNRTKELSKLKQLKKKFLDKVRQLIYNGEVDIK